MSSISYKAHLLTGNLTISVTVEWEDGRYVIKDSGGNMIGHLPKWMDCMQPFGVVFETPHYKIVM